MRSGVIGADTCRRGEPDARSLLRRHDLLGYAAIMSVSLNCIGVISIGEMGLGVARVLIAHGYRVVTFVADRRYGPRSRNISPQR